MMTLLRPALATTLLVGLLVALGACGDGRAGTQDSEKKRDRRIYAGLETTLERADGAQTALAALVFAGGDRTNPRG